MIARVAQVLSSGRPGLMLILIVSQHDRRLFAAVHFHNPELARTTFYKRFTLSSRSLKEKGIDWSQMNSYQRRAVERKSLREKLVEEGNPSLRKNQVVCCARCNGSMTLERFGSQGCYFIGMRCLLCGDVIDPVILLHRLSRDARIPIPDGMDAIVLLIKKYVGAEPEPA
jgi:hypothetical protein